MDNIPAGFIQTSHGIFERRPIYWFPMSMAPKCGKAVVHLSVVTVLSHPTRLEVSISTLRRVRTSPDSDGYWTNGSTSIADSSAGGWWAHSVPLKNGRLILPHGLRDLYEEIEGARAVYA